MAANNPFRKDFEPTPAAPAAFSAHRPLTAAAARINLSDASEADMFKLRKGSETALWQSSAWEYYDAISEIKFAFNLVANIVSRIRLFAAINVDPAEAPVDLRKVDTVDPELADAAERALMRLNSAYGGQTGLLRDAALNLSVAGEALCLDTLIPTPTGMVRMGDLRDGSLVFGGDGNPARVIKALPVQKNRPVYEVTFDSGATIVADENHLWEVFTVANRRWSDASGKPLKPKVLTTKEMLNHVRHYGVSNYAIKRAATAQTHHDLLPIDPYILGYWLGDGWSSQGAITAHPDDQPSLKSELSRAGFESTTRKAGDGYQVGVYKLKVRLRETEVLNNKHVPEEYFLASTEARLALVQGLVDSDGHVYDNGQIEFSNKNPEILQAFVRLTASLGLKPGRIVFRADGTGRVNVRAAGLALARLPRKAAKLGTRTVRDRWDYIRSITPAGTRDVRCISVDSPGNTFLATEKHIRTHNCYLVQVPARPGHGIDESWDIRSVDELQITREGSYITPRRDLVGGNMSKSGVVSLPGTAFVGRMWRAHPRFSEEPDSSLRGLLDLCDELLLLNRTYRATHRSRLNAGMVFIPDGLARSATPDPNLYLDEDDSEETPEEADDQFEEELIMAMATPIEDESSASAVVPLLIRGPVELGKEIKHIKFERAFEDSMNARYERLLERILQGLDVPKDTVTGLANVKYSNAIQIDEALYKAHIEPMLLLIVDSLTVMFLRPYLKSQGWSQAEVSQIVIWYDPSSVATRNDRAADADSGYEKMAISGDTWRRAHGFTEADAPTPTEMALRILIDKGSFTPELSEALLTVVAPEIMAAARQAQQGASVAPIPSEAADILSGATPGGGAPAEEGAVDPLAAPEGGPAAPVEGEVTPPGEDGPPFPLAEPGQV